MGVWITDLQKVNYLARLPAMIDLLILVFLLIIGLQYGLWAAVGVFVGINVIYYLGSLIFAEGD